jgi:hypothetical protein
MAQVGWTLIDNQSRPQKVGLYHGDSSGHLVIYCNMKMVQVDFNVKESRTYSFFIEDEFCEVSIIKTKDGRFEYACTINKTVDTPLNQARKVVKKKENVRLRWFGLGTGILLAALLTLMFYYDGVQQQKQIDAVFITSTYSESALSRITKKGLRTTATLYVVGNAQRRHILYSFDTQNNIRISGEYHLPDSTSAYLLPTGFTPQTGYVFEAVYLPDKPQQHYISLLRPDKNTQRNFVEQAIAIEHTAHPERTRAYNACLVQTAFEIAGWESMPYFMHQHQQAAVSPRFNRDSYLRFVRGNDLSEYVKRKCTL